MGTETGAERLHALYVDELQRSLLPPARPMVNRPQTEALIRRAHRIGPGGCTEADATTWIWSDLHLGHEHSRTVFGRPFRTAAAVDKAMMEAWYEQVAEGGTIICLGDVTVDGEALAHHQEWWRKALGVCAAENRCDNCRRADDDGRTRCRQHSAPYAPDQSLLLPPDVRAWLPEGHLAHHVSDLVDGLDLTAFYAPYEGDGRRNAPYAPRMMVKVLLYAYATGVFSSRKVARKLEEDVAFRMLAAGNFPQHRTVCEFRRRHLEDFKALFVEVVRLSQELGLARFGKLSIDGTKVRANASKRKAMSYGRMQEEERRLESEIEARSGSCWAITTSTR